jgi:predicted DCC family thiol-disulfide oxidoreductase YuxK
MSVTNSHHPVILFDGQCNLCNGVVQFIIKRDKTDAFRFASLQGRYGQSVLEKYGLPREDLNTFILLDGDRIFSKSSGALQVCRILGWPWKIFNLFILVPSFIRDMAYEWIAKNRYRWFGKKNECQVPSPELSMKFMD